LVSWWPEATLNVAGPPRIATCFIKASKGASVSNRVGRQILAYGIIWHVTFHQCGDVLLVRNELFKGRGSHRP
jgi:hypothetical protein